MMFPSFFDGLLNTVCNCIHHGPTHQLSWLGINRFPWQHPQHYLRQNWAITFGFFQASHLLSTQKTRIIISHADTLKILNLLDPSSYASDILIMPLIWGYSYNALSTILHNLLQISNVKTDNFHVGIIKSHFRTRSHILGLRIILPLLWLIDPCQTPFHNEL